MGGGTYDSNDYYRAKSHRLATGTPDFGHDILVKKGKTNRVHASLDPMMVAGVTSRFAGLNIRESRDSAEHPESLPIIVVFDVTGSMGTIPMIVQKGLCELMGAIKKIVPDPQILVGAVGDSFTDKFPIQVGQFESDNRIDDTLRSIILEGNGGGQKKESYGLAHYFAADHTSTDHYEKRGKRGFLFTMGDEAPYDVVTANEVSRLFGVAVPRIVESLASIIKRANERWKIHHLHSADGSYGIELGVVEPWQDLLGRNLHVLYDSSRIVTVISDIIRDDMQNP